MLECLVHNLKVEGCAQPVCSNIFTLHHRKTMVAQKTQQKIQVHMPEFFFAICTN
jgi:hypothetical protein